MAVSKAHEFRIYPDADQETLLRRTVGCRRFIRNLCLEQVELERERSDPRRITAVDQINELAALKAEPETAWLAEVPHHVLQQAIIDLHKGFEGFFKGEARFPRHHRKHRGDSCRFPDPKQFEWNEAGIRLPKLGWVEWVMHRPVEGIPRSVTVKRVADRWFAVVLAELPDTANAPANSNTRPAVGVDINTVDTIVKSDGAVIRLPRVSEKEWKRLADLKRQSARQVKASRNREKTKRKIADLYARWARRRLDAIHRATTHLAKNHGTVCVEALRVANMTRSAKGTEDEPGRNVRQKAGLNRSFLDVAPGTILRILAYKVLRWGGTMRRCDPAYTSQDCSVCGHRDAANREGDAFLCLSCGHADGAHANAARNILRRGLDGPLPGRVAKAGKGSGLGRRRSRDPADPETLAA